MVKGRRAAGGGAGDRRRDDRRPGDRRLDDRQLAAVASLFGVLSEATRLRLLQELMAGPAAVGELVGRTGFKQANVSKQLGVLLAAGVVDRRAEGTRAVYSIGMPLVARLCDLVCAGLAGRAADRAAALAAGRGPAGR